MNHFCGMVSDLWWGGIIIFGIIQARFVVEYCAKVYGKVNDD